MKAITKHLSIHIEYIDKNELNGIFRTINTDLQNGRRFNRSGYGTSIFQYQKDITSMPDYEEKKINGVWYQVFQSKMNK